MWWPTFQDLLAFILVAVTVLLVTYRRRAVCCTAANRFDWLQRQGCFICKALTESADEYEGTGLFISQKVQLGDTLISVPSTLWVSTGHPPLNDSLFHTIIVAMDTSLGHAPGQYLVLAVLLQRQRQTQGSLVAAYLASLAVPPLPIFFTPKLESTLNHHLQQAGCPLPV